MERTVRMERPVAADLTGTAVGRYLIRERVGLGGTGEVYLAEDLQLQRRVALKRLAPGLRNDLQDRTQLLNEARRASALNHSNVAGVYDIVEHADELFLVMEYVDGITLRKKIGSPMEAQEFLSIARQCIEGLEAAHNNGIIHGDLKPENIMVATRTGEIKLCDFGFARRAVHATNEFKGIPDDTLRAWIAGTPAYMAPESMKGEEVTARSDLFSLGVVFYEMLSGLNPFRADTIMATASRVLSETPPTLETLNSTISPQVSRIVAKMMEKDPERRPSRCAEVMAELRAVQSDRARRRTRLSAATLAIAAGVLLPAAFFLVRSDEPIVPAAALAVRNLVMLPTETIDENSSGHYAAVGMSETLNAALVKLTQGHGIQVSSAYEVRRRGVTNVVDARKDLGAHLVLESILQQVGSQVRLNFVLIDATTNSQISADTVTADVGSPFVLQDRSVEAVARMLGIALLPADQQALQQYRTLQPDAYDYYLQGRGFLRNYDRPDDVDRAIELFKKALDIDSGYSQANAGLGEAYWRKFELTKVTDFVDLARDACNRAVTLGRDLSASHSCLGTVYNGTGDYKGAIAEFSKALDLEPTLDVAYIGLAQAYEKDGRTRDAEQTYRRAIAARPQYWGPYSYLGAYFYNNKRYREAIDMFSEVVRLAPDSFRGYSNLGGAYFGLGLNKEARTAWEKSISIRPDYRSLTNVAISRLYEGDYRGAVAANRQALELDDSRHDVWANLGASLDLSGDAVGSDRAYREALRRAEEIYKVNPKDADLLMSIAQYHASLGSDERAVQFLHRSLELSPGTARLMFMAARIWEYNLKQRDKALSLIGEAVERGLSWEEVDRSPSLKELRTDPRFTAMRTSTTNAQ